MTDNFECILCSASAIFDATTGDCKCAESLHFFEGACLECAGTVSFLDFTGNCVCPGTAIYDDVLGMFNILFGNLFYFV